MNTRRLGSRPSAGIPERIHRRRCLRRILAYRKLDRETEAIVFVGCWTHARRYFADAPESTAEKGA